MAWLNMRQRAIPIDGGRLHTEADDTAAKLIHDDQDPVRLKQDDSVRNRSRLQRLSLA